MYLFQLISVLLVTLHFTLIY